MKIRSTPNTEKLHSALEAEQYACADSLARYKALTGKIEKYQLGVGPAPTEEEFTQWIAEVKRAVALRKLLDGIPDS